MKLRVYLPGIIENDDWRYKVVPRLRLHEWGDDNIVMPHFEYAGPYFDPSDDSFDRAQNDSTFENRVANSHAIQRRRDLIRRNNDALDNSDLVFVYINSPNCLEAIAELGRAAGLIRGPRVIVAFAPEIPVQNFWHSALQNEKIWFDLPENDVARIIRFEIKVLQSKSRNRRGGGR